VRYHRQQNALVDISLIGAAIQVWQLSGDSIFGVLPVGPIAIAYTLEKLGVL
jgi:hypothetical protein